MQPDVQKALLQAVTAAASGESQQSRVTESTVLNYMSEQRVYSSPKLVIESQSFRDKFKPKTSKQLAELRNYGM
jgi:hypothetical protein